MIRRVSPASVFVSVCLVWSVTSSLAAPVIRNVDVRGLQIGGTTTLTIDGSDLLPHPQIVTSFPVAGQTVLDGAKPNRVQMDITLADGVEPGVYNLWLANERGVSQPVVVAVDRLPERPMTGQADSLPVALHGTVGGSNVVKTSFAGKARQTVICEVEAQRLGGKLRPVLHVYGPGGRHLNWSMPAPSLHGDSRLQLSLPADGTYTVTLHDLQYAAPAPNFFRLKIGAWQYVDRVFPPAVERGKPTPLRLIGNIEGAKPVPFQVERPVRRAPFPFSGLASASGLRPVVRVSELAEVVESEDAEPLQTLAPIPSAVSGRLRQPREEDRYRLTVEPGQKLRFEIFADRIGSPIDPVLEVRNEDGKRLAQNDDAGGSADPRIDFTVPANVQAVILAVKDVNGRSGDGCIYRLTAALQDAATSRPDFRLTWDGGIQNVPVGDRRVVKVIAQRTAYDGPVRLEFSQPTGGVSVDHLQIPAHSDGRLLVLSGQAGGKPAYVLTTLTGTSDDTDQPIVRFAHNDGHPLGTLQPWLATEWVTALTAPQEFSFNADFAQLPSDARLPLGGSFKAPVTCRRPEGQTGPVRLTLLTSQNPPLRNNRPDPNQTLRRESTAQVEIPAKQNNVDFSLLIPAELPNKAYDLAFQAELLSDDKKTVVATAFTTVRRLDTLNPIVVALDGPPGRDVALDKKEGATVVLAGKIERLAGFSADVNVTLTGLPKGIAVPKTVVKADQTDFRLELKFPANFKPAELTGIQIVADGKFKSPVAVKSRPIPVTLKVRPKGS